MVKPIWNGELSFGLVSIPVAAFSAAEDPNIPFHLLDARDHARIRYQRINTDTGKEVPWEQIVKGYEYDKNCYLIMDESFFEKKSSELFKTINIEEFVDIQDVDILYFYKPYYLLPSSKNKKAYVLLREALKKTTKVGVAKAMIRTKEYLSLIIAHHSSILLYLAHFKEEIRAEEEFNFPSEDLKAYKITDKELKMALSLIKEMSAPWAPDQYHNEYRSTLLKWIDKKTQEHRSLPAKKAKTRNKEKNDLIDFITLLKQSMQKKRAKKSLTLKPNKAS